MRPLPLRTSLTIVYTGMLALLEYLMRNSGRPLTRALIVEHVWDIHFDSVSNVVEVHINSLRNKIDRGFEAPLIHTIRGVGYVLTDSP